MSAEGVRVVRYVLAGDSSGTIRAMREADVAIDKTGNTTKKLGETSRHSFAKIETSAHKMRKTIGLIAGVSGFGSIAFGIKDVIKAGQEWQQQQAQLRNALRNTHLPAARNMERLNRATEEASTSGGFTPQEQTQGLAQLIRQTGSATKAIRLNQEATDLARGTGLSYATSIRAISQLQTGQTGRLQRYIGTLIPSTRYVQGLSAQERRNNPALVERARLLDRATTAQEANRRVLERFGGATRAYSSTTAGSLSNAQHAFDLVSEELGKEFLPYVTRAAQWVTRVTQQFLRDWPRIRRQIAPVVDRVRAFVSGLVNLVRQHPGILRVAAGIVAVGLAVRAVSFAGSITGVTKLIRLLRALGRTRAGEKAASEIAGGLERGLPGKMGPVGRLLGSTLGAAAAPVLATYLAREAQKYFGKGIANVLGGPTDVAAAEAKNKTLQKGRQMLASPALIPALKRWGAAHPKLDAQAHRDIAHGGYSQRTVAELVRANYPGLIPGAEGVPKDYRAAVGLRHQAVHAVAGKQSGRHAGASSVRASHDTQPIHLTNVIKLNDRVLAEEMTRYTLRRGARR